MTTHSRPVPVGARIPCPAGRALLPFVTCCALAVAAAPAPGAARQAPGEPPAAAGHAVSGLVAVSTFSNVTRDPADDWLGEGIAGTVAADLGAAGLTVVGRTPPGLETAGAEAQATPAGGPSLGRVLGARWIVTGGYQRLGERLRITARLVDVATGAVRRAVRVDGSTDDVFALQDRIAAGLLSDGVPAETAQRVAMAERPGAERIPAPAPPVEPRRAGGALAGARPAAGQPAAEAGRSAPLVMPGAAGRVTPLAEAPEREPSRPARAPSTGAVAARPPTGGVGGFGVASAAGILTGRPSVRPARTNTRPRIDGRLDDAVWRDATLITEFVQQTPLDGAPATEQTEVYLAYDTQNIYLGVYAHYSDPTDIRANRSDRDQTFADDTITVYLDPFLDQQRAYVFSVNGYGVQGDAILDSQSGGFGLGGGGGGGGGSGGGGGGGRMGPGGGGGMPRGGMGASLAAALGGAPQGDSSWDALFDTGGALVEDGWTAEMAIPFKSLRYPRRGPGEVHRWGFQVVRAIPSKTETDVWAPISRDIAGFLPQMGLLDGLTDLSTSRNLEILPTFTAIQYGSLDADTGEFGDDPLAPEGGLNVKYGITPNLTADFTYNPDFSQIESDIPQIEVNQRFPLFYPELRPFFLEGQEIFQVPGQVNLIHTRTIADPRYGGKLTGKVGDMTVGVLMADDEAPGRRDDVSAAGVGRNAQVLIGRARYDLYSESYIGVIATDRTFLDSFSQVGGIDGRFRLGRTSALSFQYAGSNHRTEDLEAGTGSAWHMSLNNNGRNVNYSVTLDSVSPHFRTDTGFVRREDTRVALVEGGYRWWPQNWVINWGPRASYSRNYDFDGLLQDEQSSFGLMGVTASNLIGMLMLNRDMERYEGIRFYKSNVNIGAGLSASRRYSLGGFVSWGDQIRYGDDPFLGYGVTSTLFATLRPMSRLNADLALITSRLHDPRTDEQVFDVRILRSLATFQFTNRLLLRSIIEHNNFSGTFGSNLLLTYRVNSGTVFFVGYDDHYQRGNLIDDLRFSTARFEQTNRAFFTKLSYLFRY